MPHQCILVILLTFFIDKCCKYLPKNNYFELFFKNSYQTNFSVLFLEIAFPFQLIKHDFYFEKIKNKKIYFTFFLKASF